jgi:ribosomal silencing factor RsfS
MKSKRIVIYPKDIMLVTGKSDRHSRYLHKRIRQQLKKEEHQSLTVREFCNYMGIALDDVQAVLY